MNRFLSLLEFLLAVHEEHREHGEEKKEPLELLA